MRIDDRTLIGAEMISALHGVPCHSRRCTRQAVWCVVMHRVDHCEPAHLFEAYLMCTSCTEGMEAHAQQLLKGCGAELTCQSCETVFSPASRVFAADRLTA